MDNDIDGKLNFKTIKCSKLNTDVSVIIISIKFVILYNFLINKSLNKLHVLFFPETYNEK